jgi:TfoX/Sxy family transcriptional regulator of competence genes
MASDRDYINFVMDQIKDAGDVYFRKMFGEYAVYCDGRVVALVCDNRLFVKPTESGRAFIGTVTEAPPYPGAKMYFVVEDEIEDSQWVSSLISITARELPAPKPKKKKSRDK